MMGASSQERTQLKTGSMPCTGTETTTKTNAMLNTLKLRRVIGSKLGQTIATFQCTISQHCRRQKKVVPKFEVNEALPPLPISFRSFSLASYFGPYSRPKGQSQTWGEGAIVPLLPEETYRMAKNVSVVQSTQISVKRKTFTILTSNETIIITKPWWIPNFSNLQGK